MCRKSGILLTNYNIHRILFSSLIISIKYNEDSYFDNNFYSQIAGVKPNELKLFFKIKLKYLFPSHNNFEFLLNNLLSIYLELCLR